MFYIRIEINKDKRFLKTTSIIVKKFRKEKFYMHTY
jgi:hypothetical protein